MVDESLYTFGRFHNDIVVVLEALAGGNGPYGNSRVILDAVNMERNLPEIYHHRPIARVRDLATRLETVAADDAASVREELLAARRDVWTNYEIPNLIERTRMRMRHISDDVRRISRAHQMNSLEINARYLAAALGFPVTAPTYPEALATITGLSHPPVPTIDNLNAMRADIETDLTALGYTRGIFKEKIAAFRRTQEAVSPTAFHQSYETLAHLFIAHIKEQDPSIPRHASVKIVSPEHATPGIGGSFDYGRGGDFHAETFGVPSPDMTLPLLSIIVGHEIGGHFRLGVLWDMYARESGDPYGQVHTMHTNTTVLNEGVAEQGIIFYDDLVRTIVDPRVIAIETKLYILNRAVLGYQAAKKFSSTPLTKPEIIAQCIDYGMQPGDAERRSSGFFSEGADYRYATYGGVAYHPGMTVVRQLAERHGKDAIFAAVREPISIAMLGLKLERM